MKKFILFTFCLLAFTGITATIMGYTGYEVKVGAPTQATTTARPDDNTTNSNDIINGLGGTQSKEDISYLNSKLYSPQDTASNVSEASYFNTNRYKTKVVFNVTLIELFGYYGYYDEGLEYIEQLFNDNDNDRTNDIYSVHEYFYDISFGKVSVNANILRGRILETYDSLVNMPYDYYEEVSFLNTAKANGEKIVNKYGVTNLNIAIYSGNRPNKTGNVLWGHAYPYMGLIGVTFGGADLGTLCHEILHTFELPDLYCSSLYNKSGLGINDIMCYDTPGANTCVYNKLNLGWANISNYEDEKDTRVKTITKNGTYTLQPASSFTGVIAYKFGVKKNNSKIYFMVEYRKPIDNELDSSLYDYGLFVYRINENYKMQGNYSSNNANSHEIYMYTNTPNSNKTSPLLRHKYSYYGLFDSSFRLMYSDSEQAKIILGNLMYNDDGSISFDFYDYRDSDIITGRVNSKVSGTTYPLKDIEVYLDGEYFTTTNQNGEFILKGYVRKSSYTISFKDPLGAYTINYQTVKNNAFELAFYAENSCYFRINVNGIKDENEVLKVYVKAYSWGEYIEIGIITKDNPFILTDNSKYVKKSYYLDDETYKYCDVFTTQFKISGENMLDIFIKFESQLGFYDETIKYIKEDKKEEKNKVSIDTEKIIDEIKIAAMISANPIYAAYSIIKYFFK